MNPAPVVVLDRDGTVVVDRGYLADPEGLEFLPGVGEALRALCDHGFRLVVISNQSGVGRGMFDLDCLGTINRRLCEMVASADAALSGIYCCPHTPKDACGCRKPALGLMRRAAAELDFDPRASVVIGDKESDVEFGNRAGATTLLLSASQEVRSSATAIVPDMRRAANFVLSRSAS